MPYRAPVAAAAMTVALLLAVADACALDETKYPDWRGQWARVLIPGAPDFTYGPPWDPSKPEAQGQDAPLTPEYQAIFEANLADQAAGGTGTWYGHTCRGHGMPAVMGVFLPMEIVVTPETTYIMPNDVHIYLRRIYTDGRTWPKEFEPGFLGPSIGKWIDEDSDGRYDTLEIETRGFKGPRSFDLSGIPLHADNETVIKERIYLDKADRNLLHDEITVIDHALTRPWTVIKNYRRVPNARPIWLEHECAEGQAHVQIGKETYMLSAEGYLMPMKKDQPPPDLRYFRQAPK